MDDTHIRESIPLFFVAYARGTTTIPKINMVRQSNVMLNFLCIDEKITTTAIPQNATQQQSREKKKSRSSHNAIIRHAQSLDRNAYCRIIISYHIISGFFFCNSRISNSSNFTEIQTHIEHNHSSEDISIKKKFRGDNKMEVGKFSRVNGAWLKENVGNQVALVGKVVESDADTVKLTASVRLFNFVCV